MADTELDGLDEWPDSPAVDDYEAAYGDPNMPTEDTDILNLEDGDKSYRDGGTVSAEGTTSSSSGSFDVDEAPLGRMANRLQAPSSEDGDLDAGTPTEILDEDTVEEGLSNLGRSADGTQQVFLHLSIPGYNLMDISILSDYVQLQKVEIPYNGITDLSALSSMPYLLELDASNNRLTQLLDFEPPKNLKTVDMSFNEITEMPDLSAHHYLSKLVVDNNQITEIKGLEKCGRLQELSLAHNQISTIQGLDNLPIKHLELSCNKLTRIENLESLKLLTTITLAGNKIRSLNGLQDHQFLEGVYMDENEVIDLSEVQYIRPLELLRVLDLQRNPIRELPDYRLSILFYMQQLTKLDHKKVAACNMFNPPMEVMAARDHIMHVVYSFLQPSRVLDSTLPSLETPYPMLVLAGPQGAGKSDLAQKLVEEFSDYFGYGITHTTRKPLSDEEPGKDHHFVTLEEFEESIKMGRFLYTYSYHGDLYGLTLDAVEAIAREGLACVVAMEIEAVLTLKNTYFEPRYVLVLPMSTDVHERRLREQGSYNEAQIQLTLSRHELYANYNREHPGFFDMMIASDDIVEAYKQLRRLVMEYLGIGAPTPSISDAGPSNPGSTIDKEGTMDTMITGQSNLVQQWSKHSITDSLSQAISNLKVRSAPSPMPTTGRGIVEEQSLQRRQSAAKQAASGHKPTKYEQLLQQAPQTVPLPVNDQVGLGEEDRGEYRSYSAPTGKKNMDALPPSSPDSSVSGSGSNSSLSNISEARDMEQDEHASPDDPSPKGSDKDLALPTEALDMIELLSGSGSKHQSGSVPLAPRPGSGEGQRIEMESNGSRSNSRLGSERHRVLPPIIG